MPSNAQIISDLKLLMETGHDIELMNIYKGVPFICRGKVIQIDSDQVLIQSSDPSLVCLLTERKTKVLGSDYFEPTNAWVVSVDLSFGTVMLTDFSYLGTKLGERMIVRVEPKTPTPVVIRIDTDETTGTLADLSLNGIGITLDRQAYLPSLKPGTNTHIQIPLPAGPVAMDCTVISAVRAQESYRLSMRFTQTGPPKMAIFRYMVDRRAEIEQELASEYQKALLSEAQKQS